MKLQLSGRPVVVTGASSGIGRATALALAEEGARLALGARSVRELEQTADEARALGAEVVVHAGDLACAGQPEALVSRAVSEFGHVYGLVTCVGSTPLGSFFSIGDAVWQQAFEMKFLATVRAVRAVVPCLRAGGGGRIVVVTGNRAQRPTGWMLTSSAINSALSSLIAAIGPELAADKIGIVTVSPGAVDTARYRSMVAVLMKEASVDEGTAESLIQQAIPDGRVAEPAEVASLITYLLSPMATHISATDFVIDGGESHAT